jgi:hypothetical protein
MFLSKLHHLLLPLFSAGMLFISMTCLTNLHALEVKEKFANQVAATPQTDLAEKWGIEIVGIRMASRGHMLDFRYRVVDADKAASLLSKNAKPYLIDQESGKVLAVPTTAKVGPLRSSSDVPKEGKIYWMFFGNPGVVKTGSNVTVVIGDLKAENLIVQ